MSDPFLIPFLFMCVLSFALLAAFVWMNDWHWRIRDHNRYEALIREDQIRSEFAVERAKLLDRIQAKDLTEYKTVGALPDARPLDVSRPDVTTDAGEMEYRRLLGLERE